MIYLVGYMAHYGLDDTIDPRTFHKKRMDIDVTLSTGKTATIKRAWLYFKEPLMQSQELPRKGGYYESSYLHYTDGRAPRPVRDETKLHHVLGLGDTSSWPMLYFPHDSHPCKVSDLIFESRYPRKQFVVTSITIHNIQDDFLLCDREIHGTVKDELVRTWSIWGRNGLEWVADVLCQRLACVNEFDGYSRRVQRIASGFIETVLYHHAEQFVTRAGYTEEQLYAFGSRSKGRLSDSDLDKLCSQMAGIVHEIVDTHYPELHILKSAAEGQ